MSKTLTMLAPVGAGGPAMPSSSSRAGGGLMPLREAGARLSLWLSRSRSRRALASLDDRRLADIDLARGDALRESEKPFWRA